MTFTKSGQGFYQKSPSEFQRFTLSSRQALDSSCTIAVDETARPNHLRPPNSPNSRLSSRAPSPRLVKSTKSSPESGISVNNTIYTRAATTRSPDTLNLNLNESLRSDALSADISMDSVRVFSDGERSVDPSQRQGAASPASQPIVVKTL